MLMEPTRRTPLPDAFGTLRWTMANVNEAALVCHCHRAAHVDSIHMMVDSMVFEQLEGFFCMGDKFRRSAVQTLKDAAAEVKDWARSDINE
jgi:hypothetical protein